MCVRAAIAVRRYFYPACSISGRLIEGRKETSTRGATARSVTLPPWRHLAAFDSGTPLPALFPLVGRPSRPAHSKRRQILQRAGLAGNRHEAHSIHQGGGRPLSRWKAASHGRRDGAATTGVARCRHRTTPTRDKTTTTTPKPRPDPPSSVRRDGRRSPRKATAADRCKRRGMRNGRLDGPVTIHRAVGSTLLFWAKHVGFASGDGGDATTSDRAIDRGSEDKSTPSFESTSSLSRPRSRNIEHRSFR